MSQFRTVSPGSAGPAVELLQLALLRAGFLSSAPDGIFGPATRSALIAFQRSAGLSPDGVAGPGSWAALRTWLTGFFRHLVRPGDTLYRLASRFGVTVRAIEAANPDADPFNLPCGASLVIPRPFDVVPTCISFTPLVLSLSIEGLRARYPFIRTGIAGSSELGSPLYTIEAGSGPNQVFYNASHHANEWITTTVLMKFLEKYAGAFAFGGNIFGKSAESLFALSTLFIMPMVNPDGVSLVTGDLDSGQAFLRARAISGEYPAIPFPSGWKANINGIDPNLQYPAGWSEARQIKFSQGYVSPAPRDYVGAAPLEIRESRAVYSFTRAHDFSITLSYHTQGKVIYWKYLDFLPPRSSEIAQSFSAVSGYLAELTPTSSGYAGYKDWFISAFNRPGYTIEAGSGVSPLPLSQFDEIYSDNEGILTLALTATL